MGMEKIRRLANIELLRIVAMLLIVCYHFSSHGLVLVDYDFDDSNRFFNWLMRGIGYIGVNVYILISAYFLCKGSFKFKKLIQLILEVWFYSLAIYMLMVVTHQVPFSPKGFCTSFLPTLFSQYWFVTCYVVLYILSPFLNRVIRHLYESGAANSRNIILSNPLFKFTALLLVLFSVIPQFVPFSEWLHFGGTCGIVWMTVVYFIGASLRYFVDIEKLKEKKRTVWLLAACFWVLPLLTKVVIANISFKLTGNVVGSSLFYMNNSVIIVASSIFTFLAFCTIEVNRGGKIINFIASSTLAVYLIHDNNYIRPLLWEKVNGLTDTDWLMLQTFAITFAIFLICILIDFGRRGLFKLVASIIGENPFIARVSARIDKWFTE